MKRKNLFILICLYSLINISYAQQKVYKCVSNGQIIYSNDEKDSKCKQVEMMGLNSFNPNKTQSNYNQELIVKSPVKNKQEIYPEPIPLDYVPEKPAPIDEKSQQKQFYEQKINQMEKGYLNLLGTLLKIKK